MLRDRRVAALALSILFLATPGSAALAQSIEAEPLFVPGATVTEGPAASLLRARAQLRGQFDSSVALPIVLPELDLIAQLRGETRKDAPLRVGSIRSAPADLGETMRLADLDWQTAPDGGIVTHVVTRSTGARSVRMSLIIDGAPAELELRYFSPDDLTRAEGPFGVAELLREDWIDDDLGPGDGRYPFWSSVFEGDRVAAELWLPRRVGLAGLADATLRVGPISHLWNDPLTPRDFDQLGNSQACERDAACYGAWSEMAMAVAKYVFNDGVYEYLCTGTVMNDRDESSFIPYFLTAAHCVSTGSEASTMTMYWRFMRAQCNGANPSTTYRTTGGARLLYTTRSVAAKQDSTDHTLLRLNQEPPSPWRLAGWSASDAAQHRRKLGYGLHHPAGDLMKASKGKVKKFKRLTGDANGNLQVFNTAPFNMLEVKWKKGVTEGGSSGSGLFLGKRWPNQYLVGVLTGGASSCSARKAPDYYGRFDRTWNRSKKFRRLLGRE